MLKTLLVASATMLTQTMSGPSALMQEAPAVGPSAAIVEQPPAEFAGPPDRPFAVVIGTPFQVHHFCAARGHVPPGYIVLACTLPSERVIVFPHCLPGQEEYCGALWRHELAHLNGWRHDPVR